ncbi:hypothetical protein EVA_21299, partial [gut metagenome]
MEDNISKYLEGPKVISIEKLCKDQLSLKIPS